MRNRSSPRFIVTAAALMLAATAAACSAASPSSPSGQDQPPAVAQSSRADPAPPETVTPISQRSPADCMGAIVHSIIVNETRHAKVCITVGGVIRLVNLGPDMLSADSWDKVDCFYAGGVHSCRLIHTGTIRFKTLTPGDSRNFTVEIAGAITPPRPSTACTSERFTLNATEGGMPWAAMCVKVDTEMRVENLGPEGFSITPSGKVSCHYEAAVRECRFLEAATVTITVTVPGWEPQTLIVVIIK